MRRQLQDEPSLSEDAITIFLTAMSTSLNLELSTLSFDHIESIFEDDGTRLRAAADESTLLSSRPRVLASVLVGYKVFFNIAAAAALAAFSGSSADTIVNRVSSAVSAASSSGALSAALASQPELAEALGVTRAFLSSSSIVVTAIEFVPAQSSSPSPSPQIITQSAVGDNSPSLQTGVIAAIVLAAVSVAVCGAGYLMYVRNKKKEKEKLSALSKNRDNGLSLRGSEIYADVDVDAGGHASQQRKGNAGDHTYAHH